MSAQVQTNNPSLNKAPTPQTPNATEWESNIGYDKDNQRGDQVYLPKELTRLMGNPPAIKFVFREGKIFVIPAQKTDNPPRPNDLVQGAAAPAGNTQPAVPQR